MKHSSPFVHLYECSIQEGLDAEYYILNSLSSHCLASMELDIGVSHSDLSPGIYAILFCFLFWTSLVYKECYYWLALLLLFVCDDLICLLCPYVVVDAQNLGFHLKLQLGTLKMLLQVGIFGASSTTYHPTLKITRLTMYIYGFMFSTFAQLLFPSVYCQVYIMKDVYLLITENPIFG